MSWTPTTSSRIELFALLLAIVGVAHAANPPQLSDPINVDQFVPNAVQWLQTTFKIIARTRIFPAMEKIGMVLLLAGFVMGFIKHWPARNMTAIVRNVIMSVLAGALIHAATTNAGAAGSLYRMPMDVWATVYGRSTNAVRPDLQNGVIADTKKLALAMNDFMNAATLGLATMGQTPLANAIAGSLPTEGDSTGVSASLQTTQTQNQGAHDQLAAMKWIYQIGYLLLMGFFMAFAGVIYLSGLSVILGMLALPVALAFWANGHSAGMKLIVMAWVTAIVTVGLLPHIVVMSSNMALSQPTKYILSQVEPLNADAKTQIQAYAHAADGCARNADGFVQQLIGTALSQACTFGNQFSTFASALGSTVMHIAIGLLIMIMTLLVALGIGAAIIRALPNLIGGLLGANAGGSAPAMSVAGGARSVAQAASPVTRVLRPGGAGRKVA